MNRKDIGGGCWELVAIGAIVGGAFELGTQLISNGGNLSAVNWYQVGIATLAGGINAVCGLGWGIVVSGISSAAIEIVGGNRDIESISKAAIIGSLSSAVGYGAKNITSNISGKIAVNDLSKKTPSQIKKITTSIIDVAGEDRNMVKNVAWTMSHDVYKTVLPQALAGKRLPTVVNSIASGAVGYGAGKIALCR